MFFRRREPDPDAPVPALLQQLGSSSARERRAALEQVAPLGNPGYAAALEGLLSDPEEDIRTAARKALEAIGVEALIALLRSGSPAERCAYLRALGRLGDPRAVPALKEALRDSTPQVGRAALRALIRLGGAEAMRALLSAPRGLIQSHRFEIAGALRKYPVPEAAPLLWSFLGIDDDNLVRQTGLALLSVTEPRPAVRTLLNPLYTREDPMLHADRRLIGHLVQVLEHGPRRLRLTAARWLARIAAADPAPTLAQAIPPLNRELGVLSWNSLADRDIYLQALTLVSQALKRSSFFPVPAAAPAPDSAELPRPADAIGAPPDGLPIPVSDHDRPLSAEG